MDRVLVVAVHPDDETLGCGGTLLKHKAKGDRIYWLIITCVSEEHGFSKEKVGQRETEVETVAKMYGFDSVHSLGYPTMKVDTFSKNELVNKISEVFNEVKPNTVYLPFMQDVHSDHRVIFEAAYSCTKTFRNSNITKVLMMETISETEFAPSLKESAFMPNYFVDITDFLDKKLEIMKVYKSEIADHPFPRSLENIRALATFRGSMAGCKYAESFVMLKAIQ